jgi:choline-sulfatase
MSTSTSAPKRPNILVVMADQLTTPAMPFHGNTVVQAPALSALAERGVVFDAAYTASPLCAPARAALMTGLLPSRTGAYDNAADFGSGVPTFAHHLRNLGYRTMLSGKMHFCGPDQLHGFEERLTTDIYPADFGWTPDWDRPDHRPHWYHDMSSVIDAGPCVRTNQLDFDDEVGFAAERALYGHVRAGDPRPFCLAVSFTHPHDPYATEQQWWDLYRDDDIDLPEHGFDDAVAHPHEKRIRSVCAMDEVEIDVDRVRAARRAYYGSISYVDWRIGRLMDVLRETGRLDDTMVVLTSDHGDMLGERGLWYKMTFFEGSARVPLIVAGPGIEPGRADAPVSTMDLLPTLVELATGEEPTSLVGPLDGQSLAAMLHGRPDDRDLVVAEYLAEGAAAPIVMVRRGPLKFVHSPADPDQLYDLAADPLERSNVVDDPANAEAVAGLRAEVAARWDLGELDLAVRTSQRGRAVVATALSTGAETSWDYAPPYDAAQRYIRNNMDLGDLESIARFPPVRGTTPSEPEP